VHFPLLRFTKINAITLWKWVLYADKYPCKFLVNHERIHLDQIKRDGCFTFYYRYLHGYFSLRWEGLKPFDAYRGICYEKEAYENEWDLNYIVPKKVMSFN